MEKYCNLMKKIMRPINNLPGDATKICYNLIENAFYNKNEKTFTITVTEETLSKILGNACTKTIRKYIAAIRECGVVEVTGTMRGLKFVFGKISSTLSYEQSREINTSDKIYNTNTVVSNNIKDSINNTNTVDSYKDILDKETVAIIESMLPKLHDHLVNIREFSCDKSPYSKSVLEFEIYKSVCIAKLTTTEVLNIFLSILEKRKITKSAMALVFSALKNRYKPFGYSIKPIVFDIKNAIKDTVYLGLNAVKEKLYTFGLGSILKEDLVISMAKKIIDYTSNPEEEEISFKERLQIIRASV